jgi:hypothetical protein
MARGGSRPGAGRKPLVTKPECPWIVRWLRKELEDNAGDRERRWVKRNLPREVEARAELSEHQQKLRQVKVPYRSKITADPTNTPLEDVLAIFEEKQVSRISHRPLPSQFDLSTAYVRAAIAASAHFQKRITKRQVKRCVQSWLNFEASLDD